MNKVTPLVAKPSLAERKLIERGLAAFGVRFPGQVYETTTWSIRHLKEAGTGSGNVALYFTRVKKSANSEPLPVRFADMLKAHLAIRVNNCGSMVNVCLAARWLWEVILMRLGGNAEAFSWEGLTQEDAERAEELMLKSGVMTSSVYRRCVQLQAFLNWLSSAGVIATIVPTYRTPRQDSQDRFTLAGQSARMALLPSQEAIDALADIFQGRYELEPIEQLLSCVSTDMFASGIRVVEAIQLSTSALQKERDRYFLYYFKAKSKRFVEEKMPLSARQGELVQEAVRRALDLTRETRRRAAELVASPEEFPLPAWAMEKQTLTIVEMAELTGMDEGSIYSIPREVARISVPGTRKLLFDRALLQTFLQRERKRLFPESIRGVAPRADGTWLPLDQALFICCKNAGHATRATNPLQVGLVRQGQLGGFLGGEGNGTKSVFERLGLRERNGSPINLNAHQIRHYVTSKAKGAGIADVHLARWQRREHAGDLEAYIHLTSEERLTRLKEHIKDGRLKGEIATMYFQLAADERDIFLETVVQAIHVTHLGYCIHDFNTSPCPSALNCVKRCGSFLFDTADKDQRDRLIALRARNSRALDDAVKAQNKGQGLLVLEWVDDLKATQEGIDSVLAAESEGGSSLVAPFKGSPSRFKPLE